MEADWITAMDTGASTAVTAKYLARSGSKVLTIFGAGGLGRTHLLCLNEVFDLDEVRVVDVIPEVSERFVGEMTQATRLPIRTPSTPEEAVRDADLIITVTTGSAANVETAWLKPGAFVARLGSYQEVAIDLLLEADKLVVDRWDYVSYRVPEIVQLIQAGRLSRSDVHAEWPEIVAGRVAGRGSPDEIILYIALGISAEYAAILPMIYRTAKALDIGTRLTSA
jgi:ornithine cyclodeaminase